MIETLENINYFLVKFLPYSFGAAFIGFLIAAVAHAFNHSATRKFGLILLVQAFIFGIILIILQNIIISKIKKEVLGILSNPQTQIILSKSDFEILPTDLKMELLKIEDIATNHTHPENEKSIEVISPNSIFKIYIAEDSDNKNQFWIFTDKYKFSRDVEIGKINSNKIK